MIHTIRLDNKKLVTDFVAEPEIGDVLQRDDNSFVRIGSIRNSITNFENYIRVSSNPRDIQHTNEDGTEVDFGVNVEVPVVVQAGLGLAFDKKNSRFVTLKDVITEELEYLDVQEEVELFWKKKGLTKAILRDRTFLVTTVVKAASGSYIYSGSANNKVYLSGKGNIPVEDVQSALEGRLDVKWEKKLTQKIISDGEIRCMFQAVKKQKIGFEILG